MITAKCSLCNFHFHFASNDRILGDKQDFRVPLVSLVPCNNVESPKYSDISDDDFMQIPCSQIVRNETSGRQRCVL